MRCRASAIASGSTWASAALRELGDAVGACRLGPDDDRRARARQRHADRARRPGARAARARSGASGEPERLVQAVVEGGGEQRPGRPRRCRRRAAPPARPRRPPPRGGSNSGSRERDSLRVHARARARRRSPPSGRSSASRRHRARALPSARSGRRRPGARRRGCRRGPRAAARARAPRRARRASGLRRQPGDEPGGDGRGGRAEPALERDPVDETEAVPFDRRDQRERAQREVAVVGGSSSAPSPSSVTSGSPSAAGRDVRARSRGRAPPRRSRTPARGWPSRRAHARRPSRSRADLGEDRLDARLDERGRRGEDVDRGRVLQAVAGQDADDGAAGLERRSARAPRGRRPTTARRRCPRGWRARATFA